VVATASGWPRSRYLMQGLSVSGRSLPVVCQGVRIRSSPPRCPRFEGMKWGPCVSRIALATPMPPRSPRTGPPWEFRRWSGIGRRATIRVRSPPVAQVVPVAKLGQDTMANCVIWMVVTFLLTIAPWCLPLRWPRSLGTSYALIADLARSMLR
jgi:hypothetical protein